MSATQLLNRELDLSVSDPWEFGTECGEGPFPGRVTEVSKDSLVIVLDEPLLYRGKRFPAVIIKPRHVGESTDSLVKKPTLIANFLFLTGDPLSIADLRMSEDVLAAIGTVTMRSNETNKE